MLRINYDSALLNWNARRFFSTYLNNIVTWNKDLQKKYWSIKCLLLTINHYSCSVAHQVNGLYNVNVKGTKDCLQSKLAYSINT